MPIGSIRRRGIARPALSATSPLPPASAGASSGWPLHQQELPRASAAHPLQGRRIRQDAGVSDQSFRSSSPDHCRPLQKSMASGAFLQVDQAAPADQAVLRHVGKCGEDADLDRGLRLCPRRHRQEAPRPGRFALHTLLQIFSVTLFEKIDLKQALTIEEYKTDTSQITKQLNLFTF